MSPRKKTSPEIETTVLVQSGRRCCLCFGLKADLSEKRGQIAHLDKNPANDNFDNLTYLCLEHHDQYDSRTSQSKGLTINEVKHYRSLLFKAIKNLRENKNVREASISMNASKQTAILLPRIKTGKELVDVAIDAHFYYLDHDELKTEEEANLIGDFLQDVIESCEDLGSMGMRVKTHAGLHFDSWITTIEKNGFWVFGTREKAKEKGKEDVWIYCFVNVIRNKNSSIVDLENIRNSLNDISTELEDEIE